MNSRRSIRIFLALTLLLVASLACRAATDFFEGGPDTYQPEAPVPNEPPVQSVPQIQTEPATDTGTLTCPTVADNILKAATGTYEEDTQTSSDEQDELYLVTYSVLGDQINNPVYGNVSSDLLPYQEDKASQQEIWNYFTTLIPLSNRSALAEYSVVTDGTGNMLAAVAQTEFDPALWGLEVDIRDSNDKLNLTYTLIHEYAHLLTLGPDQVTPSIAIFNNPDDDNIYYDEVSACPDYFPGEGCSKPDSYVNAFYNEFWADIYGEWQDINLIENDDAYYDALDDFYYKYEDRFVTDYAVTNPEEDMAETFAFFILSSRPAGDTIAEKKILFFYDYPELVQLREKILNGVCKLNP